MAGEFAKICKTFFKNCKNCTILAYSSKTFKRPALNFRRFGRKTVGWKFLEIFDQNSIETLNL